MSHSGNLTLRARGSLVPISARAVEAGDEVTARGAVLAWWGQAIVNV